MTVTTRAWTFIAVMVMVGGAILRFAGATSLELWSDEARWCEHLLTGTGTWFRPAGYMWVTRQILDVAGITEPALRSLSTVAGIALLPVAYLVLRAVVRHHGVAVMALWVLAIHPVAVAMSKEFKPYIVETLLHAALVLLALKAVTSEQRRTWLAALCVTSVVAPFFAWTVVFAYPGIYLVVGLAECRARRFGHLAALATGCVATLAVLVGIFFARLATKTPATEAWGKKYDVFYVGEGPVGFIPWFVEKTADLAAFPARLHMTWSPWVEWGVRVVGVVLLLAGAVSLLREQRHRLVALLIMPWGVMVAFNAVGAWPYGLFRTNTFMLFYTLILVGIGLDAMVVFVARRAPLKTSAVVVAIAVFLLTFPFEPGAFAHKGKGTLTSESSVRASLERIYAAEEGRPVGAALDDERFFELVVVANEARRAQQDVVNIEDLPADAGITRPLLVLDGHACTSMRHYRDRNVDTHLTLEDWIPGHFVTVCGTHNKAGWIQALKTLPGRDFWLVAGKTGWPKVTRHTLAPLCEINVDEFYPPSTHLLHCRRRPDLEATAGASAGATAGDDDREGDGDRVQP